MNFAKSLRFCGVLCLMLGFVGCSAQYRTHGYLPLDEDLSEIIVGADTRETVSAVIGAPTMLGLLRDDGFYYVKSKIRSFAYHKPQTVSREVVAISFGPNGVVQNIERFGLEDGKIIAISARVTRDTSRTPGVLAQIFGALGQFNPATLAN